MQRLNLAAGRNLRRSRILVALFCVGLVGSNHPTLSAVLPSQNATTEVIAVASAESVRFVCLGELIEIHLEVIGSAGETLFDSGFKSSNVIDWGVSDSTGKRLADGSYLCVLTVKDSRGKTTRRLAIAILHDQSASLKNSERALLSAVQADAAGAALGDETTMTIVEPARSTASAVLAHDGNIAHLSSGAGGLSISTGDFFANKTLEHIRLTAEGNVGIGTANPQAKLDVTGRIRASEGVIFPDGSIQLSAASKTLGAASIAAGQSGEKHAQGQEIQTPDTSGTGTTGKIPRWLDGPNGVLADSNITEVSGAIGINASPNTSFRLDVNGSTRIRGSNPGFNLEGLRPAGNIWLFQTVDDDGRFRLFGQDNVNPGVERLTISLSTGNVGIGATGAAGKLDVGGAINTSTQYNIGGARMLSAPGTNNLFAGAGAGNANNANTGIYNSFFGKSAGLVNSSGAGNSFFGALAGTSNTTGVANSFFGNQTGQANTTASSNSFFGNLAGADNTTGEANSFFGDGAGLRNATSSGNSFFGGSAGAFNTGDANSFFGYGAGQANTTGMQNAFFGQQTGVNNTSANGNAFFGSNAGTSNTTGGNNLFAGFLTGTSNTTGSNNTIIGASANVGANNLSFATAIGAGAVVSNSNTIILGRSAAQDSVQVPGKLIVTGNIDASTQYNIGGARMLSAPGSGNLFVGAGAGNVNTGAGNSFFGNSAGFSNTTGSTNTFVGANVGATNATGNNNTLIGAGADVANSGGFPVNNATAIGAGAVVSISNRIVLGTPGNDLYIPGGYTQFVGDISAKSYGIGVTRVLDSPSHFTNTVLGSGAHIGSSNLTFATAIGTDTVVNNSNSVVLGRTSDTVRVPGGLNVTGSAIVDSGMLVSGNGLFGDHLSVINLGVAGSTSLCRNGSSQIATCSSSLRYKTAVSSFTGGLDIVRRLRPITFKWKDGGLSDVGFGAEEVEKVEPLLTTRNDKGEIEGVKYGQITTVLVNAIQQQQAQIVGQQYTIEQQQRQNQNQQRQLDALKKLVCSSHRRAAACRE